jgi:peptidoglycan/LPS O-acetylase OafA/YrhL
VWTISVEFQFYLVAPFVFAFTAHRGIGAFLLPLFALIFILKMMVLLPNSEDPGRLMYVSYYTIVGRMGQFLIGVGLAYVGVHHPAAVRRRTRWIMVGVGMCGILVLMTALNRDGGVTAWRGWHAVLPEMEGLFWALFIAGYVGANPLRGRLGSPFAFVGKRSFSLYILHWPVLKLAMQLNAKYGFLPIRHVWPSFALWMIVLLPPLLGLIWLSFRCIEEPFLGLRGRYIKGAEPLQKDRVLLLDQSQRALAGH